MADTSVPRGSSPDAGWGPSTSVRTAAADAPAPRNGHALGSRRARSAVPDVTPERNPAFDAAFHPQPTSGDASPRARLEAAGRATRGRGVPGWLALLVLIAITVLGILIDAAQGHELGTGFNVGIITGSVVAILIVRRSGMFPIVVAPPIVYSLSAGISLYIRSSGLHDHSALIDAATNWLVYGFPAIAGASAAVLIIAGFRLITRR